MFKISSVCRTSVASTAIVLASWSAVSPLAASSLYAPPAAPQAGTVVQVSSEPELQNAVAALTSDMTIVLAPGTYKLASTLSIKGTLTNVVITGATNNANDVVLVGMGMANSNYGAVPHGVSVSGSVQGITIANLTIRDVFNHAIALGSGTEQPRLYNLRLIDAGRQFVKAYPDGQGGGVDDGLVEHSVMEYTQGSRDADTGAVHVSTGSRWIVRINRFQNIKAPTGQLAGPAVAMSQGSRDSFIERNTFINCQREIALGLEDRTPNDHAGGIVRNNFIVRDFATQGGTAIQVADSPNTQVLHNTILSNTASTSLIEYRFRDTTGVVVRNNLLDGQITAHDGARGTSADNYLRATSTMFGAPASGDLHLVATAIEVIDQASGLMDAAGDFDGEVRPQGNGADYGADEYVVVASDAPSTSSTTNQTSTTSTQSASTLPSTITATATGLPSPWQSADVGAPQKPGSASWSSETFTVRAAGSDIGGNADQFTFVYQTLEGDGEIVARVASLERTHPWAKAGVMIRDELLRGAKYASALVTAEKGLYFQHRIAAGATTTQIASGSGNAPLWLKLARKGQTFTAFASTDGSTWRTMGSETVYLNRMVYVGLAVTSRSTRVLTTASFTGVRVTAAPTTTNGSPVVAITSPTTGAAYNAPCTIEITAAASDPDGSVTKVDFYAGSSLIGTASSSPYRVAWSNVPAGRHTLKAIVSDNGGAATTSPAVEVNVVVNQPPTVSLASPSTGATFSAPATITLSANASDADGAVAGVDFFAGSALIGSDTTPPYSTTWSNVAAGSYTLTAIARDNTGVTSTSAPIAVTVATPVNQPPIVGLTAPSSGRTYTAPGAITMTATAADADGTIAKVDFYAGSTLVGSDTSSPYSVTWNGAPTGTYTLSAKAWDNIGASAISGGINVIVETASTLPAGWQTMDIGNPLVAGSASYNTDTFTVSGAGADIGGTADQFRFVYQPLNGDGAIVACVTSLDFVDSWTKTGVMVRESLTAESAYAFSLLSAGWGVAFQQRTAAGQVTSENSLMPGVAPHCVRLVRKGSILTAYQAVDGSAWVPMGSATIAMSSSAFIGLAVTSHKAATAATAVFTQVALSAAPQNQAPAVSLTAPAPTTPFTAPAEITLSATATDADGSVAAVDFYAGTTLVGSDTSSPYSVAWNGVAAGTYSLTAVARDDKGASTTSAPVAITVAAANQPPVVSVTAPSTGATFTAPINLIVSATASDPDGSVSRVDFYAGAMLIGSDTISPYSVTWSSTPVGTHALTAVARDNTGRSTTSAAVSVTIRANQPPTVSLAAPASGATFTAPATIALGASATDSDGTISGVDFYAGSTLVGSDSTSPYSASWSNVAQGSYTLTAVARDNNGATTTSGGVSITVAAEIVLPRYVVFNPSTDHDTMVTGYTVEFFAAGADPATAPPVGTQNLGKPTPVNGEIMVDVAATIRALPAGTYFATASATGSGGTSRSAPCETFVR